MLSGGSLDDCGSPSFNFETVEYIEYLSQSRVRWNLAMLPAVPLQRYLNRVANTEVYLQPA